MSTWQSRVRASRLTRRLPLTAAIVAGLALTLLGTGCGSSSGGGSPSPSPIASPSASSQAGLLRDSQSKRDALFLNPGTYTGEFGNKLPNGSRDVVDWFKVRLTSGQSVIDLNVTIPKDATYYVQVLAPYGKTMGSGSFADLSSARKYR